jgi:hypothetical protein
MKRPFPRIERRALLGLAAALTTLGAACTPNQSVKPGAPVLTEIEIVEFPFTNNMSVTSIPSTVAECPASTADGGGNGIDGQKCDPLVTICRLTSASNWCRCVPNSQAAGAPPPSTCTDAGTTDAAPPGAGTPDAGTDGSSDAAAADAAATLGGTWNCAPFSPVSAALFVFDRLLDTAPLDPGDASGGVTTAATATTTPVSVTITADYASNGSPNEVIFPLLGDFRSDGPSLLFAGQPELPGSSTVSITLKGDQVRAKDGKTPFTGAGFFAAGNLTYTTAAFGATLTTPPTTAAAADAGACTPPPTTVTPDMTPATLTFNDPVDPAAITPHITIVATPVGGGAPTSVAFDATTGDGLNVSITPKANWPASSSIAITIDASTPDLVGDTLGTAILGTFTTSAM